MLAAVGTKKQLWSTTYMYAMNQLVVFCNQTSMHLQPQGGIKWLERGYLFWPGVKGERSMRPEAKLGDDSKLAAMLTSRNQWYFNTTTKNNSVMFRCVGCF